jgi:hypothetical protein
MSFRLPKSLGGFGSDAVAAIEQAIVAEKAASLGHAGRLLERSLAALAACDAPDPRPALVKAAADHAHALLIQRELCGLRNAQAVIDDFNIPREVIVRMGAK